VGRAEQGEDPWGPHRSEFHVDLRPLPARGEEAVEGEIRAILGKVPGIQFEVMTFLGDRIGESISGETAPVVVNLFGDDLDALDAKAAEVAGLLGSELHASDVQVKSPPGAPRVAVRLRQDALARLGFRPLEVLDAVQAAYQGVAVAQVHRGTQATDVAVLLDDDTRRDPENVGTLLLRNTAGRSVPLREVADVYATDGRFSILHEGARRRQTVTCSPGARDVAAFVADARRVLAAKLELPKGTYLEFGGSADAEEQATRQLLLNSAVAGVGILILLRLVLRGWRNLLLLLVNLPFALAGGVLAVQVAGWLGATGAGGLTMGALVGFVTLFGITTRNSIMLLSHYDHLVRSEGHPWSSDTAILGAGERLVPILITALVTGLGLLPLALGSGEAGREIEGPMAIVILGGLVTSTVLNLLVLPALAARFGVFGTPGTE
jgi:Cu/Ag efflux pump CusA